MTDVTYFCDSRDRLLITDTTVTHTKKTVLNCYIIYEFPLKGTIEHLICQNEVKYKKKLPGKQIRMLILEHFMAPLNNHIEFCIIKFQVVCSG